MRLSEILLPFQRACRYSYSEGAAEKLEELEQAETRADLRRNQDPRNFIRNAARYNGEADAHQNVDQQNRDVRASWNKANNRTDKSSGIGT